MKRSNCSIRVAGRFFWIPKVNEQKSIPSSLDWDRYPRAKVAFLGVLARIASRRAPVEDLSVGSDDRSAVNK